MTLRTLPLLLLLLPGCVGKGKYNALEAALTEAKTENADLRGSLSGKDQELEAAKEEIARLEAQQLALKDTP